MRSYSSAILFLACGSLWGQQSVGVFADRDSRYHLQPNDVIEIQYRYTPEYNQIASVEPDGFVSLELIGNVKLAGLTIDDARAAILTRVSIRLRSPELSLLLKDYEKPHFTVGGEVASPGRFELRGHTTAVEAIAMAGGLRSGSAKHSEVILFRKIDSHIGETRILNLKQIMFAPKMNEDVALQPGDVLLVPQNKLSKIERFVKWGNFGVFANPIP
jgi:polysaccharide export outer membrane protein